MSSQVKDFKVVCRGSMLSRAQAEFFIGRAQALYTKSKFSIVIKDTAGDLDQQTTLPDMDGRDFFTKDIQDYLLAGRADFAVHSLKDVSSEQFFKNSRYAVLSREDPRDVAIFNSDVTSKIERGHALKLGTSSPRRALMAKRFLEDALPVKNNMRPVIEPMSIRGNVDTRLQKLHAGQFDGIVLAVAGINRLLSYDAAAKLVSQLLRDKKIMVLPLVECPPAPGQGVIVAEAVPGNTEAVRLLEQINDKSLLAQTRDERSMAAKYGAGCHQQFGVVHISTPDLSLTYGAGVDNDGKTFDEYLPLPTIPAKGMRIFSAGDHMKALFSYKYPATPASLPQTTGLFVGSQHALQADQHLLQAANYRIWAAGTKTWKHLAKKGVWIEGCADALGLQFIEPWLKGPLIGLNRKNLSLVTDSVSVEGWIRDGWIATGAYSVEVVRSVEIAQEIASADVIFWTSYKQFSTYRDAVKPGAFHCCSTGSTAARLRESGIEPIVFAGIKGFNKWRDSVIKDA